jgi:hypothetical protein
MFHGSLIWVQDAIFTTQRDGHFWLLLLRAQVITIRVVQCIFVHVIAIGAR